LHFEAVPSLLFRRGLRLGEPEDGKLHVALARRGSEDDTTVAVTRDDAVTGPARDITDAAEPIEDALKSVVIPASLRAILRGFRSEVVFALSSVVVEVRSTRKLSLVLKYGRSRSIELWGKIKRRPKAPFLFREARS
jgi:hypothetical protein